MLPSTSSYRRAHRGRRADLANVLLVLSLVLTGGSSATALVDRARPGGPVAHILALKDIANRSGGKRASGSLGFDRSADYIAERLREAGYRVRFEEFSFPYFAEHAPPVLTLVSPEGAKGPTRMAQIRTLANSGSGDVTARVQVVNLNLQQAGSAEPTKSGCDAADFAGFKPGSVALLRRGTCPFQVKVENATAAGAAGAIIMNEGTGGRTKPFAGRLRTPASIPVVGVPFDVGQSLASSGPPGDGITVRLAVDAEAGTRTTRNVLGEAEGVPAQIVMVGAHLDSVEEGPGINDNGSGTAAVLEAALRLAAGTGGPPPGIRFAFWGAEEEGLFGSRHHLGTLAEEERRRIALYINLDMIGSLNFGRFIEGHPHPPESLARIGRNALLQFFREHDLPVVERTHQPAGYGSDGLSFAEKGIPTVGLHTGAGEAKSAAEAALFGGRAGQPYDPCYHQACDTAENVNVKIMEEMTDALVHSLRELMAAMD